MRTVEALTAHVRRQGGKATAQRLLIWSALYQDRSHPTVDDLYRRLKPAAPSLSLTTLYNVLNELVEWGDVRRFDAGDGHIHFDPDTSGHAELVCLRCHRVVDAPDGAIPEPCAPAEIAGFAIVTRSEQFFGFCPTCRRTIAATASVATPATSERRR